MGPGGPQPIKTRPDPCPKELLSLGASDANRQSPDQHPLSLKHWLFPHPQIAPEKEFCFYKSGDALDREERTIPKSRAKLPLVNLNQVLPESLPTRQHTEAPPSLSQPMPVYKLMGPDGRKMWLVPLTGLGTNSEPGSKGKGGSFVILYSLASLMRLCGRHPAMAVTHNGLAFSICVSANCSRLMLFAYLTQVGHILPPELPGHTSATSSTVPGRLVHADLTLLNLLFPCSD